MRIRRLQKGDEDVAAEICRMFDDDDDGDDGGRNPDRAVDPRLFLERAETVMFVVDDDESHPCGCVYGHELLHPDGDRTMLLYSLDVAEPFRRRGYGTALVNAFVDHARETGCSEVWVLTDDDNAAALATYGSAD